MSINIFFSSSFSIKQTLGGPLLFRRPDFMTVSTAKPSKQLFGGNFSPAER